MVGNITVNDSNNAVIYRLTALWALCESGLGGIMFAFKIPFTGFLIGAFAIIIISLIAAFSNRPYRDITQSLIIVLMIKLMVSPHSPPAAYLAVAFQGLVGALLFQTLNSFRLACVILGTLSMVESASQKIILLTLVFGKSIWEAVNAFFSQLKGDLNISLGVQYSTLIIIVYLSLYALWGALVGLWASGIPVRISKARDTILTQMQTTETSDQPYMIKKKRNGWKKFIWFAFIVLFIAFIFLQGGAGSGKILKFLLRSVAAVLLLFFVLKPLVNFLMQRWLERTGSDRRATALEMIRVQPEIINDVRASYRLAAGQGNGIRRIKYFIISVLVLSVYKKEPTV